MNLTPDFNFFLCGRGELDKRMHAIDPKTYDKTRNYLDGHVTWLSPFTTHGIISTRQIADAVMSEHKVKSCYRLLFELAWREYFHRTWQLSGMAIFSDMRQAQSAVRHNQLPAPIVNASTGIHVIDNCLDTLVQHGVMHNHARMWVAAITCNMAGTYWREPARWLHYHLLDGDLASNSLSWQWVAGTFSHKTYVANQSNIDKYSKSRQTDSWLDVAYEAFDDFDPPSFMLERSTISYRDCPIPETSMPQFKGTIALRSIWNLDPLWCREATRHIVFVDTQWAQQWPMSPMRWQFIQHWADACNATIYRGTLDQLLTACENASVVRKEYPACKDWPGQVQERDWLYPMPDEEFPSFSRFFKQVKQHAGL